MGKWRQRKVRGSGAVQGAVVLSPPPAPVLDFHSVDHANGGFDVASQSAPPDPGGTFLEYLSVDGGVTWGNIDSAAVGDIPPLFVGSGLSVGNMVYVTELGNGIDYAGESVPSNIETV